MGEYRNSQVRRRDLPEEVQDLKDLCSLPFFKLKRERRHHQSNQDALPGWSCFTIRPLLGCFVEWIASLVGFQWLDG